MLEPALARKAIVTGFYTMNFKAIVEEFSARDALVQLPDLNAKKISGKLAAVFVELLQNKARRARLAENAFRVIEINRGAVLKTIAQLKPIFELAASPAAAAFKIQKRQIAESRNPANQ